MKTKVVMINPHMDSKFIEDEINEFVKGKEIVFFSTTFVPCYLEQPADELADKPVSGCIAYTILYRE